MHYYELLESGSFYIPEFSITPFSDDEHRSGVRMTSCILDALMCYTHALVDNDSCLSLIMAQTGENGSFRIKATPLYLGSETVNVAKYLIRRWRYH